MKRRAISALRWLGLWPLLMLTGCTGIVVGADFGTSSQAVQGLDAKIVRVEFGVGSSPASMEAEMAAYQSKGAQVVALAGFESSLPTLTQAQSLSQWATHFGPGSAWAANHGGDNLALHTIEFGNETSYGYQYSGCVGTGACYSQRAQDYATRFMQAREAINFAGHSDVILLAQADHGGNGTNVWVHGLKLGGLTSAAVGGWTVHPYGANPTSKIGDLISQTAAEGFSSSIPVDVTEYGISAQECNGSPVFMAGDSQGWGNQLSYAQAASDLNQGMDAIRSYLGERLALLMIFGAKDGLSECGDSNREGHFGCLKSDLSNKGNYSAECRDQLTQ